MLFACKVQRGFSFESDTDTEVIPKLMKYFYDTQVRTYVQMYMYLTVSNCVRLYSYGPEALAKRLHGSAKSFCDWFIDKPYVCLILGDHDLSVTQFVMALSVVFTCHSVKESLAAPSLANVL